MINSLQSIRYILALMIFVHHYVYPPYNPFGDFPVAFFFILSGYVMTLGYQKKMLSPEFDYKIFLFKRIKKVYPLHFIMMVIALMPIVISAVIHFDISRMLSLACSIPAFLLIQSWIPDLQYTYAGNSVSWFLSSMIFCYIMAPFIIRMISLYTKKAFMLLMIVLIAYFVVIYHISGPRMGYCVYIFPIIRLIDFTMGAMLYKVMAVCSFETIKNLSTHSKSLLELLAIMAIGLAMLLGGIVLPQYELASLYWIPSILVIFVFALFGSGGGIFQNCSIKSGCLPWGLILFPSI